MTCNTVLLCVIINGFGTLSGTTISSLVRGDSINTSGATAAHADDSTVELYQIHSVPLDQINKTHTAIANIDTNAYTVTLTTAPTILVLMELQNLKLD